MAVESEDATGFTSGENNVAALACLDLPVEPLGGCGRGIESGGDQDAVIGPVFIPIVAGQMLVIPIQFAGVGVDRESGIAVQIGWCVGRNRIEIAAVALEAGVGRWIRNTPDDGIGSGIVSAREAPRA